MDNHKKACELGEQALTDALEKIDDVDEDTFRDAKSIIKLANMLHLIPNIEVTTSPNPKAALAIWGFSCRFLKLMG